MAHLRSGPRAVAAAGLAETAAVSAPRGLAHNLVYLIYSVNRHDRFRHLLAIVAEKELPAGDYLQQKQKISQTSFFFVTHRELPKILPKLRG